MATILDRYLASKGSSNSGGSTSSRTTLDKYIKAKGISSESLLEIRKRMDEENARRQKEAVVQRSQEQAQSYAQEAKGGLLQRGLNAVNKFIGRGVAEPILPGDSPEVIAQKQAPQPTFIENIKNTPKAVGDFLTQDSSKTAFDVVERPKIDKDIQERLQNNVEIFKTLQERNAVEKDPEQKARREKLLNNLVQANQGLITQSGGDLKDKKFLQLVGQSVGTALDLTPFLGFTSLGTQAVERGTQLAGRAILKGGLKQGEKQVVKTTLDKVLEKSGRNLVKDATAEGALFGGAQGLSGSIQNEDATIRSVAKDTAIGAGVGAGLGLGLSGILSRLGSRSVGVVDELKAGNITAKEVEDAFEEGGEEAVVSLTQKSIPETQKVDADEDSLLQEARKYKSAEEFVNSKPTVFHGTNSEFDSFDLSKVKRNGALFFSDSEDTAIGYGKNVKETQLDFKNPVEVDAEGKTYSVFNKQIEQAIKVAKENGNDVVIFKNLSNEGNPDDYLPSTHYAVLDQDVVKTKSQLTDLYNKATKKEKVPSTPPKPQEIEKLKEESTGDTESMFAKRLNEELPEDFKIDEKYSKTTFKREIDGVAKVANEDPELAMKKAMGRTNDDGNTQTATNILLSEKAKEKGDWKTVSELYNARRVANTRRGQEIAMERLSTELNPEEAYMKKVMETRMEGVKVDMGVLERIKGSSKKEKVLSETKKRAKKMSQEVTQKVKFEKAQKVFNDLICQ